MQEAQKLRDEAVEDLDMLQKRTQFELIGLIDFFLCFFSLFFEFYLLPHISGELSKIILCSKLAP